jgi:hypothetical protein
LETVRENTKMSVKQSLGSTKDVQNYYINENKQIAFVTGSEASKWGQSEQNKT